MGSFYLLIDAWFLADFVFWAKFLFAFCSWRFRIRFWAIFSWLSWWASISLFLFFNKSKLFWLKFFIFIFCAPDPVELARCRLLLEFTRLDGFEFDAIFIFDLADCKAARTEGLSNFVLFIVLKLQTLAFASIEFLLEPNAYILLISFNFDYIYMDGLNLWVLQPWLISSILNCVVFEDACFYSFLRTPSALDFLVEPIFILIVVVFIWLYILLSLLFNYCKSSIFCYLFSDISLCWGYMMELWMPNGSLLVPLWMVSPP